jgi:hypothetical protein
MVFILIMASIVTFAGYLNALEGTWMRQRVHAFAQPDSAYAQLTLNRHQYGANDSLYREHHAIFYDRLVEAYVKNTYSIHVPFFGVTFDANDLGLIGGLSFVVILMLLRFSLGRERDNLRVLFERAESIQGMLSEVYDALAMRQVFTLPPRAPGTSPPQARTLPRMIVIAPMVVQLLVAINDFATPQYGTTVSRIHTAILYSSHFIFGALMLLLTVDAFRLWITIDQEWTKASVRTFREPDNMKTGEGVDG